jgi:hypothetical protein
MNSPAEPIEIEKRPVWQQVLWSISIVAIASLSFMFALACLFCVLYFLRRPEFSASSADFAHLGQGLVYAISNADFYGLPRQVSNPVHAASLEVFKSGFRFGAGIGAIWGAFQGLSFVLAKNWHPLAKDWARYFTGAIVGARLARFWGWDIKLIAFGALLGLLAAFLCRKL